MSFSLLSMIDINVTECSKGMYLFCFIFYLFIVLKYWKSYTREFVDRRRSVMFRFLVVLYVLLSFYNGDFWHYQSYVKFNDPLYQPSELYYVWLAEFVNHNYLLFRFFVWGLALFLILRTAKNFKIHQESFLFFFFTLYISIFDYARVSLALALYFLGISKILSPQKGNFIMGVLIMISSVLFHNSIIPLILFSILLVLPFNKSIIVILFILLPTLTGFIDAILMNLIGLDVTGLEEITYKLNHYNQLEGTEYSILEKFRIFLVYLTFYIPFALCTYVIHFKNESNIFPYFITQIYKILYLIVLLATCCLFLNTENNVLFYRYLYMAMIPISVLVVYLKEYKYISNKCYKYLLLLGVFCLVFRHAKYLYVWSGPVH